MKEAILAAGEAAGGPEGLVGYLKIQAIENPGPFLALLGKVIPLQVTGENGGAVQTVSTIRTIIVDPDPRLKPPGVPD